jgi:hypothetical protein
MCDVPVATKAAQAQINKQKRRMVNLSEWENLLNGVPGGMLALHLYFVTLS